MLKIFDGRRYNTESARLIRKKSNNSAEMVSRWEETLYRTKTGLWFLHCEGGAKTIYAAPCIRPINEDAAVLWLTDNFGHDAAQDVLCTVYGKSIPVTVLIPQILVQKIEKKREETGKSRTDVILDALQEYFR